MMEHLTVDELGEPGAYLSPAQWRGLVVLHDAGRGLPATSSTSPAGLHYKSAGALERFGLIKGRYDRDAAQVLYEVTAEGRELVAARDRFYNR